MNNTDFYLEVVERIKPLQKALANLWQDLAEKLERERSA